MEVELRPLTVADSATSVQWRNDPEIWRFTASAPDREISLDDEMAWARRVTAAVDERRYAIVADRRHVGNIYLTGIDHAAATAEYHVLIGVRDMWGKGVAERASRILLGIAREELELRTVHLSVNDAHDSAIRLYERLGFTEQSRADGWVQMSVAL